VEWQEPQAIVNRMRSRDSSWLGTVHRDGNEMMGEVIKSIKRGGKKIAPSQRERERSFHLLRLLASDTDTPAHAPDEEGKKSRKIDSRVHHRSGLNVYALRFVGHSDFFTPHSTFGLSLSAQSSAKKVFQFSRVVTRARVSTLLLQSAEQTAPSHCHGGVVKSREQINSH
jgi:hypothetical protein